MFALSTFAGSDVNANVFRTAFQRVKAKSALVMQRVKATSAQAMQRIKMVYHQNKIAKRCAVGTVLAAAVVGIGVQDKPAIAMRADFEKFVKKHQPPEPLRSEIERHKQVLAESVYPRIKEIPDIIRKPSDISRVINAERMRRCMEMFNLDQLGVAQKYFYKVGDSWEVLARYVTGIEPHPVRQPYLKLVQVQQLAKFAEETGFRDWTSNWRFDMQGKFTCIDTEDGSFAGRFPNTREGSKAEFVGRLTGYQQVMEPEAFTWLQGRITALESRPEGTARCSTLMDNTKFDDPEINIANVKRYYSENGGRYCD